MQKPSQLMLLFIVAALSLSGCGNATPEPTDTPKPTGTPGPTNTPKPTTTPTDTPTPTSTPAPTATRTPEPGDIVLQESFRRSRAGSLWDLAKVNNGSAEISSSKLMVTASREDTLGGAVCNETFSDMDLQVQARILQGGEGAMFGLSFGRDDPEDSGVLCLVRADDSAACTGLADDEDGQSLVRASVSPQGKINRIRLITSGDQWTLLVNEHCIGSGRGNTTDQGEFALLAGTDSDRRTAKIAFDSLIIRVPDEDSRHLLGCQPQPYQKPTPRLPSTPEPRTPEPRPTDPPVGGDNGTVHLSSETTTEATCRLSVWGGGAEDFLLDAGPGHPASEVIPPGTYAWQMHLGPKGRTQAAEMQLSAGGTCSFTCTDQGVRWGCSP